MKQDINIKYLEQRIAKYGSHDNQTLSKRTGDLATREINTLQKIFRLSGYEGSEDLDGKRILDLGCGDQFIRSCLEERGAVYTPIDYDTADFNTDSLPYSDEKFDLVISLAVIEHISNVSNFMSEIMRVLKSDGVVYLSTPNFRYCYRSFFDDPTHVKPYTNKSIERLLKIWGFKNVRTFPGVRCKSSWFYSGDWRFTKSALIPFRKQYKLVPKILSGRSTSVIAVGKKPKQ